MRILMVFVRALTFVSFQQIATGLLQVDKSTSYGSAKLNTTSCYVKREGDSLRIWGQNCALIPESSSPIVPYLEITHTGIDVLGDGDLDQFANVTSLTIESNTFLSVILPGAFDKMKDLINLTITDNLKIQSLAEDAFSGLVSLRRLNLVKNGINNFLCVATAIRPSLMPSLSVLDVSHNIFTSIADADTAPLNHTKLQELHLSYCSLNYIDTTAFDGFDNLEILDVYSNNLRNENVAELIAHVANASKGLRSVYLGNNYVSDPNLILTAIAQTDITLIDLRDSHFSNFNTDYLPKLPKAEYLDFSSSGATGINNNTFCNFKLPSIKYLYLAHNQLLSQKFTMILPTLEVLDLSDNTIPNGFGSVFCEGNLNLTKMAALTYLKLDDNPIEIAKYQYFMGLKFLKELHLFNTSITSIDSGAFSDLVSLEILNLSGNIFETSGKINNSTFIGLGNLTTLYLDNSQLTCLSDDMTFIHTPNLQYLSLVDNTLLELHPHILLPAEKLEFLDISCNAFQSWDERLFEGNFALKRVNISNNQIAFFTEAMLLDFAGLESLNLDENPFSCACSDLNTLWPYVQSPDWKGQHALEEALNSSQPFCWSPASLRFREFIKEASDVEKCANKDKITVIILIAGIGGFVLLGLIASYFLRWHIKYWAFIIGQTLNLHLFSKKKFPQTDGDYAYDAFVSYSNEDRAFVVRLISMLEGQHPHFRLCVFERDFHVGGVITANVVECLMKSKRTILVLSDSFAKSTWCQWEMNLAQHRKLLFKDNREGTLIMIKIGEIMEKHMTPSLRYLTKTRIYLEWSTDPMKQKIFWEKLRYALAKPLSANFYDHKHVSSNQKDIANNNNNHNVKSHYLQSSIVEV